MPNHVHGMVVMRDRDDVAGNANVGTRHVEARHIASLREREQQLLATFG
jgi:REP element-mobilizing transposase RayT